MHSHEPNPAQAGYYDAKTYADAVAATPAVKALSATGNRIGAWVSLQTPIVVTAVQPVYIGVKEQGKLRVIAAVSTSVPSIYLSIDQYGTVLQEDIWVATDAATQTVSVGDIQRTYKKE